MVPHRGERRRDIPHRSSRRPYSSPGWPSKTPAYLDMNSAGHKPSEKANTGNHSAFAGRSSGSHVHIRPQLDEEAFPLEAQLTNFRPVEGVNLSVTLR